MSAAVSGVPAEAVEAGVGDLLGSDAMTPNHDATPEHYFVDAENVEYLVGVILAAALPSLREQIAAEVLGPVRALHYSIETRVMGLKDGAVGIWDGQACATCRTDSGARELWPCATIAALSAPVQAAEPTCSCGAVEYGDMAQHLVPCPLVPTQTAEHELRPDHAEAMAEFTARAHAATSPGEAFYLAALAVHYARGETFPVDTAYSGMRRARRIIEDISGVGIGDHRLYRHGVQAADVASEPAPELGVPDDAATPVRAAEGVGGDDD